MEKLMDINTLMDRQMEKSWKVGLDIGKQDEQEASNGEMNENLKAVVEKLPEHLQKRAAMLWEELQRLNIKQGLANRLMGMGHMGALNDPIWKYIYKLHTEVRMSRIRNKGSWLLKCLLNDKLKQKV